MNAYQKIKLYIVLIFCFIFPIINLFAENTKEWITIKLAKDKGTLSDKLIFESTINSDEKMIYVLINAEITTPNGEKFKISVDKVYDNIYAASFDKISVVGEYSIKVSAEAISEKTNQKITYEDELTYKVQKKFTEQMSDLSLFNFMKKSDKKVADVVSADKDEQTTSVLPQTAQIKEVKTFKIPPKKTPITFPISFISFLIFNLIALYTLYYIHKNRDNLLCSDIEDRLLKTYKKTIKIQNENKGIVS